MVALMSTRNSPNSSPGSKKPDDGLTALRAVRRLTRSGGGTLLLLLGLFAGFVVLTVLVQKRFGTTWSGVMVIVVAPLILARFMRPSAKGGGRNRRDDRA